MNKKIMNQRNSNKTKKRKRRRTKRRKIRVSQNLWRIKMKHLHLSKRIRKLR